MVYSNLIQDRLGFLTKFLVLVFCSCYRNVKLYYIIILVLLLITSLKFEYKYYSILVNNINNNMCVSFFHPECRSSCYCCCCSNNIHIGNMLVLAGWRDDCNWGKTSHRGGGGDGDGVDNIYTEWLTIIYSYIDTYKVHCKGNNIRSDPLGWHNWLYHQTFTHRREDITACTTLVYHSTFGISRAGPEDVQVSEAWLILQPGVQEPSLAEVLEGLSTD